MLLATDFMCESVARATSVLGLGWQASPTGLNALREGIGARISGAFTFPGHPPSAPPRWLAAEGSTTVDDDGLMALKVSVALPLADGGFVVQGQLGYPDFHEVSAAMVDASSTSEQRVVTQDMVLRVFRAARECGVLPGGNPPDPIRVPQPGALELFTVFALSRMYRAGLVVLDEGSAGLLLLQCYAARELTEGVAAGSSEADKWFRKRLVLRRANDVYLDAVLYDIELRARHGLAGVMTVPPTKDPAAQLQMLRQAMAAHPAAWASARLSAKRPEIALAFGVDLESRHIPLDAIGSLLAGFSRPGSATAPQ